MMTKTTKKKTKKTGKTGATTLPSGALKTYEIRKIIKAHNIVEAFNLDPQTPPEYLVMVDPGEEEELEIEIGFKQ